MLLYGLESSIFDFATFALLLYGFHAALKEFRTAWFIESLLTEILILLIIRTRRPFLKSKPSRYLLLAAGFTFLASLTIPYLPFAGLFELYPLPFNLFGGILAIIVIYVVVAEFSKKLFFRKG